ncbi:MAG: DotU family type VI secretion system protein [Burkholderiaceae bacterium]
MTDSDPFSAFESERTVIKPSAGRARAPQPASPATAAFHSETMRLPEVPGSAGLSPLLQAASSLLIAGARIRVMAQHPDPAGLRNALVEAVRKFEADARARGLPNEQVVAGRYLLCTYVDECASTTPWGGSGAWSSQSLLVLFHNESWGGEKLFQLLGKLAENVPANRGLLELIYCILALGFEGRYRVLPNGRSQLDTVREKLALMLRENSGSAAADLSPHWAGVAAPVSRLRDGIPVWVVASVAALVLVLVFLGLRWSMSDRSSDTFTALQALDVKPAAMPAPLPPVPAPVPRLSGFLKPDIDAGLVAVQDLADRSIITVPGDGLFDPGSAKLSDKVLPLMGRIADALQRTPGQILVSGNTDNQPIRSVRFPSNWELSKERAQSVQELLATKVKPERIRSEGLADTKPLVDNTTAAGRAKNRRVEITLRLAAAAG